jgi:hypothetical protein
MEIDSVGYARSVRLKKAEPTSSEKLEFKLLALSIAMLLGALYAFAIIGASMFFWRIFG